MPRSPRSTIALVAIAAVLLVALAALQYRWIGELSRAESERLRASLHRASRQFAGDLERELGRLVFAFAVPMSTPMAREDAVAERFELWHSGAVHPDLVKDVWLFDPAASSPRRLDPTLGSFRDAPWPAELAPIVPMLASVRSRNRSWEEIGPLFPEVPALLVPRLPFRRGRRPRWPAGGERGDGGEVVVLRLDRGVLRDGLLADLAERHFGPAEEREYDLAIVREGDLIWAPEPGRDSAELLPPDVRVELLTPRRGDRRRPGPGAGPEESGREARRGPAGSGWELIARHRRGSHDAAVEVARRRNLAVSLGVLAMLGATAGLLTVAAQRSERAARQQMEFVAGVTHELHTPLAAICAAGQNLADGVVADASRVRHYGAMIQREGQRLTATVGQILEFAGIASGGRSYRLEPIRVAEVVDAAIADNALALEEAGLELERDLPDDLPVVHADAAALRRALNDLIGNAAKFAASGGWVGVRGRVEAGQLELRVEDRGPGVSPAERARVFEPFYRGRGSKAGAVPGSGLGLSIVEHVARAHGGAASLEEGPGGGAAFVLRLPIREGSS